MMGARSEGERPPCEVLFYQPELKHGEPSIASATRRGEVLRRFVFRGLNPKR